MKVLWSGLCLFVCLSSLSHAWSYELFCEAWYQNPGAELIKQPMQNILYNSRERQYKIQHQGYVYTCNWDVGLDTFYKSIATADGKKILFTTARVPTFDHNDSFTDLNLPNGPRLAINCHFK